MIWLASLDPANLALNIDVTILTGTETGKVISKAILCCASGDIKGFADNLDLLETKEEKARCAYFASTIWHEQRHFIDLVLTNYGNYIFSQYTACYNNSQSLIQGHAANNRDITFPLDVYIDSFRRSLINNSPSEQMCSFAKHLKARENYLARDRKFIGNEVREIGGYAQLEAIGTICQIAGLERNTKGLGLDIHRYFDESSKEFHKYAWVHKFSDAFQFQKIELGPDMVVERVGLFPVILYAALSVRGWGKDAPDYKGGACTPAERFSLIVNYALNNKGVFSTLDFDEMWFNVNKMAKELFGRTVLEEIEVDLNFQREKLEFLKNIGTDPSIIAINEDHLELREILFSMLKTTPDLLLSPDKYAETTLPRISPIPILNFPQGVADSKLKGFQWQGLISAIVPDTTESGSKYSWSATPDPWQTEGKIGFKNIDAWKELFTLFTPLAKAMLKGRNHRTSTVPEFLFMENTLRDRCSINPVYEPEFEYPQNLTLPASYFYDLKGTVSAICDVCKKALNKPDGHILSPWVFHQNDRLKKLSQLDGWSEDKEKELSNDWSAWLVCDSCRERCTDL